MQLGALVCNFRMGAWTMDTRDLLSFVAVYRGGSINRASKELFMSPQGLGKTLRRLEAELGVTLFDRDRSGIVPTRAADTLYRYADKLLDDFDDLVKAMDSEEIGARRTLRVSFTYGVLSYLGIDAIRSFEEAHPNVRIDLAEMPDDQIKEQVKSGKTEVAVVSGPVDMSFFDARFLASVRHVALVSTSHPLAEKDQVSYGDFDGETVFLIGRGFTTFQNNLNRLARAGAVPERLVETGEIHKIGQFVNGGFGVGISVEHEAYDVPFPNVVVRQFIEPDATWDLFVAHRAGVAPDPEVVAFSTHLTDHVREGKGGFLG